MEGFVSLGYHEGRRNIHVHVYLPFFDEKAIQNFPPGLTFPPSQ